jgi:hypothetical protein
MGAAVVDGPAFDFILSATLSIEMEADVLAFGLSGL